jgi:hypothetical protein
LWDDEEPTRRTLGIRDKKILFERAGHKCESCEKPLDFLEMQVGHKTAASKGGNATLRNTVCLCYKCNNLMGTDSWTTFRKKMGKRQTNDSTKKALKELPVAKLKFLAKKFKVKVRGRAEESWFETTIMPPTKMQYVNALAKKISADEITQGLRDFNHGEPADGSIEGVYSRSSIWGVKEVYTHGTGFFAGVRMLAIGTTSSAPIDNSRLYTVDMAGSITFPN